MTENVKHTLHGQLNFYRVAQWLRMAGKQPNGLTMGVQSGVMLEEMTELFETMTLSSASGVASVLLTEATRLLKEVATQLKSGEAFLYFYDRKETLDAMCDIDVTVNGVAYLGGFLKAEADERVINSLFDKFMPDGTPVILPGGKVGKRPGWVAPDLSDLVGELGPVPEDQQPWHPYMEAQAWAKQFHAQNPSADVEDAALIPLITQAMQVGAEQERERTKKPISVGDLDGVQQLVKSVNASAEESSNSILPSNSDGQN